MEEGNALLTLAKAVWSPVCVAILEVLHNAVGKELSDREIGDLVRGRLPHFQYWPRAEPHTGGLELAGMVKTVSADQGPERRRRLTAFGITTYKALKEAAGGVAGAFPRSFGALAPSS